MTTPATTPTSPTAASARDLLRHAVATLAYRGAKAARGAPAHFARLDEQAAPRAEFG